jgi:hypothetical protein
MGECDDGIDWKPGAPQKAGRWLCDVAEDWETGERVAMLLMWRETPRGLRANFVWNNGEHVLTPSCVVRHAPYVDPAAVRLETARECAALLRERRLVSGAEHVALHFGLDEKEAARMDSTAYLLVILDTSTERPSVLCCGVFSEPRPTLMGNRCTAVVAEQAADDYETARRELLTRVDLDPHYAWARALLSGRDRVGLDGSPSARDAEVERLRALLRRFVEREGSDGCAVCHGGPPFEHRPGCLVVEARAALDAEPRT